MFMSIQVALGDFVSVCPEDETEAVFISQVVSLWEDSSGRKQFHGRWFSRSSDTVLGEVGDPMELFLGDECDDIPLGAVLGVVKVERHLPASDWAQKGGEEVEEQAEEGGSHFFYQKW